MTSTIPPSPGSYIPPSASSFGPLPVPAGTSPFHVKGLAYRGYEAYVKHNVGGGMERVCRDIGDARLRQFLMQPFMAGCWYDILPVVPLSAALAAVMRTTVEDFMRRSARRQALYDTQTVHKRFYNGHKPGDLMAMMGRIFMQYTDFGSSEVVHAQEGQGVVSRTGVPVYLLPWFMPMNEAYIEAALGIMGSERPRVRGQVLPKDGEVGGMATVTVRFRMVW